MIRFEIKNIFRLAAGLPADPQRMRLFKSKEKNTFHYVTTVTFRRLPIFRRDEPCQIFVDVLDEIKKANPFKLVGYVIMPDHVHLILNPLECEISVVVRKIKGKSARLILDWLKVNNYAESLSKLVIRSSKQTHAVWQKEFSAIDLWSPKFINQKLNYVHLNPVRAGLCDHPAKWKWSSCRAYLPHAPGEVPIEIDWRGYYEEGGQARR